MGAAVCAAVGASVLLIAQKPAEAHPADRALYDLNSDGVIDGRDVDIVGARMVANTPGPWDVDRDGWITSRDVALVRLHFGPVAGPTWTRTPSPTATRTPTRTPPATPTRTPAPTNTPAPTPGCAADPALDTEERAFLTLINNHRAANGRAPLAVSYTLTKAAAYKSYDMGAKRYFGHNDLDRTWIQRIQACGYNYPTYVGENIIAGPSSAQAAFNGWRNSAGHNSNMLSTSFRAIGIGRAYVPGSPYGWYWTTVFGGVADGNGGLLGP
jgi:uncharacterized protein YkwD